MDIHKAEALERLGDIAHSAFSEGMDLLIHRIACGEEDERNRIVREQLLHFPEKGVTVHLRHHDIADEEIDSPGLKKREGFTGCRAGEELIEGLKYRFDVTGKILMVLDDKDSELSLHPFGMRKSEVRDVSPVLYLCHRLHGRGRGLSGSRAEAGGEYEAEGAPLPDCTAEGHLTAILLHNVPYQRETETGLHLDMLLPDDSEASKNPLREFLNYSGSGITYREKKLLLISHLRPYCNGPLTGSVFQCIGEKIEQKRLEVLLRDQKPCNAIKGIKLTPQDDILLLCDRDEFLHGVRLEKIGEEQH